MEAHCILTIATFVIVLAVLIRTILEAKERSPSFSKSPDFSIHGSVAWENRTKRDFSFSATHLTDHDGMTSAPVPFGQQTTAKSPSFAILGGSPPKQITSRRGSEGVGTPVKHNRNMSFYEGDRNHTKNMLRLVYLLERALAHGNSRSVAEWAMSRSKIVDDMLNAMDGNYHCVLQLTATLNNGGFVKTILDGVIDKCDLLNNIREQILIQRICNIC